LFGAPFYFSLIRKYVILMGTLLNNIRITRTDKNGNVINLLKVPITYAPKDKMLARVMQDPALDRNSATLPLPMISFEMGEIKYDGTRKLDTINKVVVKSDVTGETSKFKYQYNPVPYNIGFKVYIYAKNVEDGTKIIEQILPYFTPDWTTTCNLIPEMEIAMDIPIILTNINYSDKYDGEYKDRRMIIWSLDFLLKGYFYGPVKKTGIIKFINVNFFIPPVPDGKLADAVGNTAIAEKITIQPGLDANGNPITYTGQPNNSLGTVPYLEIESDDDYGFITMIYNEDEIENE
jgi:hypothetical protein